MKILIAFACLLYVSSLPAQHSRVSSVETLPDEQPYLLHDIDSLKYTVGSDITDRDVTLEFPRLSITFSYLGSVENNRLGNLHWVTETRYTWLLEDAKRANTYLLVYNDEFVLIGLYHTGAIHSLPDRIAESRLVFESTDTCVSQHTVDMASELPNPLFVSCNGAYGDLYYFRSADAKTKKVSP